MNRTKGRMGSTKNVAIFPVAPSRRDVQDLLFPVDEGVEIAARALSSGVNDPFIAMRCIDWLAPPHAHARPVAATWP
jgi:uncharacterized membrane protein